jgi:uncharacterized protein (TIGR00369 family)
MVSQFSHLLGIREVLKADEGKSLLEMDVKHFHLQSMGWAHGGAVTTLADCGMYHAVAGTDKAQEFVTASLSINFMAPSKAGDSLTCASEVIHNGRSTAVARCIITGPSGNTVAVAQATFMKAGKDGTQSNPE